MTQKIVVAYDGSASAGRALDFAADRAKQIGASLIVAHVLEWSPYSFLTPGEIEERHKRRAEELERAESHLLKPLVDKFKDTGLQIETALRYGHVADTLGKIATEAGAVQIISGRTGDSGLAARVFGSVAGSLAQTSPVPVTIVP